MRGREGHTVAAMSGYYCWSVFYLLLVSIRTLGVAQ